MEKTNRKRNQDEKKETEKGKKEERERRMAGHLRPAGSAAGGQGRQSNGQPKPDQGKVQV